MGKRVPVIDPLAEVKANPRAVKRLTLNPAAARNAKTGTYEALSKFPTEIFACTNLVELEIFRGIDYRITTIPDAIGGLRKLKRLSLGGLGIRRLPDSIGLLGQLEALELYYDESLNALPKAIGKLSRLVTLVAGYAGLGALPDELGKLRALRELRLDNTKLKTVPAALWRCTNLERLALPDTIGALPPGIGALTKLTELSLSAVALASIASELGALRALKCLRVRGKAQALPSLAELHAKEVSIAFVGIRALPELAPSVVELDVSGNQLSTLVDALAALPALKQLDYAGNPVAIAERRVIDKLMKLPPKARRAQLARGIAPAKPARIATPAPMSLGTVASINASLSMIVGDAAIVGAWRGVGDGDELDDSDWQRACDAHGGTAAATIAVGASTALALSLEMGSGIATVYRVGERIVVVEGIGDRADDELYLEYVASPAKRAKRVATLAAPSGSLALVSITDAGDEALRIAVPAPQIAVELESEVSGSWGNARRCLITPITR